MADSAKKSSFNRFVEVGRICLIKSGYQTGKIAVIVEIIDHARAILDNPAAGVPRGQYFYRDLTLTPIVMKIPRGARSKKVKKEIEAQKIIDKWESSSWAKRRAALQARKDMGDFGRFEVMVLKKRRRDLINKAVVKLKADARA